MEWRAFKQNGTRLSRRPSVSRKRLAVTLSAMCLMTLLTNCVTTGTTGTVTDKASRCAAWRAITYSAKGDTKLTVQQIRTHNLVGRKLGCWK